MSVRTNYWLSYQGRAAQWQRWATTCTNKQTPREFPRREEGARKCCCFRKLSVGERESKWSGIKAAKWNTPDSLLLNRVFHLEPRGWFLTGAGWGAHECRCHSGETSKNVFNWRICAISWNYTKMHKQPCKMAQSKKEKKKKTTSSASVSDAILSFDVCFLHSASNFCRLWCMLPSPLFGMIPALNIFSCSRSLITGRLFSGMIILCASKSKSEGLIQKYLWSFCSQGTK